MVGRPTLTPILAFDPRGVNGPLFDPLAGAKNDPFFPPCGAKSRGGGGAPPTNLILLRNQCPGPVVATARRAERARGVVGPRSRWPRSVGPRGGATQLGHAVGHAVGRRGGRRGVSPLPVCRRWLLGGCPARAGEVPLAREGAGISARWPRPAHADDNVVPPPSKVDPSAHDAARSAIRDRVADCYGPPPRHMVLPHQWLCHIRVSAMRRDVTLGRAIALGALHCYAS